MKWNSVAVACTILLAAGCGDDQRSTAAEVAANTPAAEANIETKNGVKPVRTATLASAEKEDPGPYLIDAEGRSLYLLKGTNRSAEAEARGMGAGSQAISCTGACAERWPPLLTSGEPIAARGVDSAKLGTIAMNGSRQVTYAGWPLFYYRGDRGPGGTSGQDLHDRWGEWYLISPDGKPVEAEGHSTKTASAETG